MSTNTNNKPFIKKFKTKKNNYIYDVNSNNLLRVNKNFFELVDEMYRYETMDTFINEFKHKFPVSYLDKNYKIYTKARFEKNLLSSFKPNISFGLNSFRDVERILSYGLNQIILELTQRCNQRCKYCAYSGRYYQKRKHTDKDMTLEIAKRAIDFFEKGIENNDIKKPIISFYGGEPLLKFNLLKKIVNHYKNKNKFGFSLSTNGTLLNSEKIKYLVRNNVNITVSIDGPKFIHDRNRVYKNGKGTFDRVMNKLEFIKRTNLYFFKNNLSFNAVITPPYDFQSLINFFYKNPFFSQDKSLINFSPVDSYETSYFKDFNLEKEELKKNLELNELKIKFRNALIEGKYDDLTIEKQIFGKELHRIHTREMNYLSDRFAPQGQCFPGKRRLFVSAKGKFYMCERVGNNYEIGDVKNGFDYNRIYDFFIKYEKFFKKCKDCWALRLCSKCFNNVRHGENLNETRRDSLCNARLFSLERNLIDYCEIREKNQDAFKPLEEIRVI